MHIYTQYQVKDLSMKFTGACLTGEKALYCYTWLKGEGLGHKERGEVVTGRGEDNSCCYRSERVKDSQRASCYNGIAL